MKKKRTTNEISKVVEKTIREILKRSKVDNEHFYSKIDGKLIRQVCLSNDIKESHIRRVMNYK